MKNELINKEFGKLKVLEYSHRNKYGTLYFKCHCKCGNVTIVRGNDLKRGNTKSCGECFKFEMIDNKFGRLTVLKYSHKDKYGFHYECKCKCGNKIIVRGSSLIEENTKSCGCLNRDINRKKSTKHGKHNTPEYITWQNMNQRCYNSKHNSYKNYGGRGIQVRWKSFEEFYKDMEEKPEPKGLYSIERKDSNGHYCKDNCIWATKNRAK